MSKRSVYIVLSCALFAASSPAFGQITARPRDVPFPDTTVTRPLIDKVFETLVFYIGRASRDTVTRPWRIVLPDSAPPWEQVRKHLLVALRARPVTPADSEFYHIEVGPLRVSGDTVRSQFVYGFTRLCPGSNARSGYSNVEDVYMFRVKRIEISLWSTARSDFVRHGDSVGCRVKPE